MHSLVYTRHLIADELAQAVIGSALDPVIIVDGDGII